MTAWNINKPINTLFQRGHLYDKPDAAEDFSVGKQPDEKIWRRHIEKGTLSQVDEERVRYPQLRDEGSAANHQLVISLQGNRIRK